ncbi:MAG: ATP-binding protein [Anaerolineales bacterium]|nr:ATP-binding protein [Anaerolineales bacterium]
MKLTPKLILAFLFVSVVSAGLLVGAARFAANRQFGDFINERYKAELAEELARYYSQNGSWDDLDEEYEERGRGQGMRHGQGGEPSFFIADEEGTVIVGGMMRPPGYRLSEAEMANGVPIIVDDAIVGILFVFKPMSPTPMDNAFLQGLYRSIFASAVGATLLALVVGVLLSRSITRPLRELTRATRNMTGGALGEQVPVRSRDEIGELAQSFNKMSGDLERSLRLRKQMTADIAHELRTPLSLILGHAEGVKDGVLKPTRKNFDIIREEAERLERLVNDLRTLSLADAGELSMEFQPVDVNALISGIHARYLTLFNRRRIALNLELDPGILQANLDPSRFAQVLDNILDNALHHTPETGRVDLQTRRTANAIQISIQDSGRGVRPAEAERLFDRFYRVDQARARASGGSGLGLAIAKSLVEIHKGKIRAESEEGKGLRVVIELPLANG